MAYVRCEVRERLLVEEAIDPDGIEGFGHVKENCAVDPLFAEIHGHSFSEVGQLQQRAMSGSEPKLFVSHQCAFFYYM